MLLLTVSKRYEDAARNSRTGVAVTVNGATALGTLAETSSYYAASYYFHFHVVRCSARCSYSFASAVVWMRIGKQVIQLSATYPRWQG